MADLSTYSDILDLVYGIIGDDPASPKLLKTSLADVFANESLNELAEHSDYIDEEVTASLLSGAYTVTKSSSVPVFGVRRVEIDNEAISPIDTERLYRLSRTWQEATGEPRWYYMDGSAGLANDNFTFYLYPKSGGSYSLRAIYSGAPDGLSYASNTDKVMLPLWATPALAWGILAKYYESAGRRENKQTAGFYRHLFEDCMDRLRVRSYARLGGHKAYGQAKTMVPLDDFRQLMPADGFPTS